MKFESFHIKIEMSCLFWKSNEQIWPHRACTEEEQWGVAGEGGIGAPPEGAAPSCPDGPHHSSYPATMPHLGSHKPGPRGHFCVQLMFSTTCLTQSSVIAGGPTMFMICHLEMMMSYVDIWTAIQQNRLPLGCMCKQFPHTPTEAKIWQSSSIFEQCRYSIWILLDTKVDTFWGSWLSNDPTWHSTLIKCTWQLPPLHRPRLSWPQF